MTNDMSGAITADMWSNGDQDSEQSFSDSDHELSFASHSINTDSFNSFTPCSYHEMFILSNETSHRTTTASSDNETSHRTTTASSDNETSHRTTTAASNDKTSHRTTTAASNDTNHRTFTAASNGETDHQTITAASSFFSKSNIDSTPQEATNIKIKRDIVLQSGFSFGERSTSFEPTSPQSPDEDDDSYKVMEEIYGTEVTELTTFKDRTPSASEHHVFSQRIGKVGYIGQNLALGHIIESFTEDSELRPKMVKIEVTEYIIDQDSPVQIDVKWSKPENAAKFKSLTYNIEMKPHSSHENWMSVSSVKFPVFRIYHTDDKLLLGKVHLSRQPYDLTYVLRFQTQGEIHHNGVSHILCSDWSKDIVLTFCGYQIDHKTDVSFSL